MNERKVGLSALSVCCLILSIAAAAQTSPTNASNGLVYYEGDGIKRPALASTDASQFVSDDCKYDGAGIIRLSLVVNTAGGSENVAALYPFGDNLDKVAMAIAKLDHFIPGTKDGVPVPVAEELEVKLILCTIKVVDDDGKTSERIRLKSAPVQRLSPAPKQSLPSLSPAMASIPVTPENKKLIETMMSNTKVSKANPGDSYPVPIKTPEAEFPPDLRARAMEGACLISVVVDANGSPQAMRVVRSMREEFDEKALEAVAKYLFSPAKKNKDAIPVRMLIEVNFRLH